MKWLSQPRRISPLIRTFPRFDGKSIYIDVEKALKSGAELVTTDEILKALDEYKVKNPHLAKRVDKIAAYVRDVDKEILIKGEKIPAKAIFTPESLREGANKSLIWDHVCHLEP